MEDRDRTRVRRAQVFQTAPTAAAEPNLACEGCPASDIRMQVSDTRSSPLTAIGMLAREKEQPLSKCAVTVAGPASYARHMLTWRTCPIRHCTTLPA